MEIVPYGGWIRNVRLTCNNTEMIVTAEVGPRVISYGPIGGVNMMVNHAHEIGGTGGSEFKGYGGHRLWIGPEEPLRTLQPDNDPVEVTQEHGYTIFTSPKDVYHTQKQIRIKADTDRDCFVLEHRIYNHGGYPLVFAPWTPTQCAGGEVIFPQAPHESHADRLLPTRPLVMWGYTKIGDPRWTWGDRMVRLRYDANMGPTKIGTCIDQGYAACVYGGNVFLKRFPFGAGKTYPDQGCNFETFTRQDMLEIESLGPMQEVPAGGYAEHIETWYLIPNQVAPAEDGACADWLAGLASTRAL